MKLLRLFFLLLILNSCTLLLAQAPFAPSKYNYKGKTYLVYPVRTDNPDDIPPTGFSLPDGEYILFGDYDFKRKNRQKKMVLRDTTQVMAVFPVKNSLPEGKAMLFDYNYRWPFRNHLKRRPDGLACGDYKNGLREGEWEETTNGRGKTTTHWKEGKKEGYYLDYDSKGRLLSREKYHNDQQADTVISYYPNGKIREIYDVLSDEDRMRAPMPDFYDRIYEEDGYPYKYRTNNKVKTFYQCFYKSGGPEFSIRFTYGKNPRFDTLFLPDGFICVEKINERNAVNNYKTTRLSRYKKTETTSQLWYEGYTPYRSLYISKKLKKSLPADTTLSEVEDYKKLNLDSWQDIVIARKKRSYDREEKIHLVPAAGYIWSDFRYGQITNRKPALIDSIKKEITVRDTFYCGAGVQEVREKTFSTEKLQAKEKARLALNEKFHFLRLVDESAQLRSDESPAYSDRSCGFGLSDLCERQYITRHPSVYVKNGIPLTDTIAREPYYTRRLHKRFSQTLRRSDNNYYIDAGPLVNGKQEGRWSSLELASFKKISGDFEKDFYRRPRNNEFIIVKNYRNGLPDGNYAERKTESIPVEKYNADTTDVKIVYRLFTWLAKDCNYKAGKLHGPYKEFFYNGQPQYKAAFSEGHLNGKAEFYTDEGRLKGYCTFRNDTLHGEYAEFVSGRKTTEAWFENNMLEGSYKAGIGSALPPLLEISASRNIMKRKTQRFAEGALKEEIIFRDSSAMEFCKEMAGFSNYLELRKDKTFISGEENMYASYKAWFENGQVLCEGDIVKGYPAGKWKFYNIAGALINEVNFRDTVFTGNGGRDTLEAMGILTGYFNNGKLRCRGYVLDFESGYDCSTHQDKTEFDIHYTDTWTFDGEPVIRNGNGSGTIWDENGKKIAQGAMQDMRQEGVWKYYDPNEKLYETGKYLQGKREGLWYRGDLENLNFEDAACFDPSDKEAQKELEYSQRILNLKIILYQEDKEIRSSEFSSDMNKEREYEGKGRIRAEF